MKFIERIKFRYFGRKVPIVRYADNGNTIEFIDDVNILPGILQHGWDGKGYEIPSDVRPVKIIKDNRERIGYAVSEKGVAVNVEDKTIVKVEVTKDVDGKDLNLKVPLYKEITLKWEGVIGKLTTLNLLEKGIDLEPNDRQLWIGRAVGFLIGMAFWALFGSKMI